MDVQLPDFHVQPSLLKSAKNTDWSHDMYKIKELHEKGYKGEGIKIAVLDTGIDLNHNCFKKARQESRIKAFDARTGQNDPKDKNGHGTWVASRYIADGTDVLGFAPNCTLYSYKVLNDNGSGDLRNVINAVNRAIVDGCDIISSSLGWKGKYPNFDTVVKKAEDAGILWISAAGNDGKSNDIDYPAIYDYVISVGSHDKNLKRSSFSDFGDELDLYCSGEAVYGAYLNNTEGYLSGTSMATPSLGGLLALMHSYLYSKHSFINREILKKISTC